MILNKEIKYEVIDNCLNPAAFRQIQDTIYNDYNFKWHYLDHKSSLDSESDIRNFQFVHLVYADNEPKSDFFKIFKSIEKRLDIAQWVRIKVNLTTPTKENYQFAYHKDVDHLLCKTAVLYLNTNDGYTAFPNGEKVLSVANRLVMFDSSVWHAGSTCTDIKNRIVLNLNFIQKI